MADLYHGRGIVIALTKDHPVLAVKTLGSHEMYWALPGGKVLDGETPFDATVRELWEECRGNGLVAVPPFVHRSKPFLANVNGGWVNVDSSYYLFLTKEKDSFRPNPREGTVDLCWEPPNKIIGMLKYKEQKDAVSDLYPKALKVLGINAEPILI